MLLQVKNTTAILQRLRLLMLTLDIVQDPLAAYIVPSGDAHHSLRMADCDQRRAFVSGFDGSSGIAVITHGEALLWTDARYFIQAEEQLDENWTLMREGSDLPLEEWLTSYLAPGSRVGLDPKYYGLLEWEALTRTLSGAGLQLASLNGSNLVDLAWEDRPACPTDPVRALGLEFAGKGARDKVVDVRQAMAAEDAEVLVVTELDEVAWLLNLRGSDLPLAPVFNCYVILTGVNVEIFIDPVKLNESIRGELEAEFSGRVSFYDYGSIFERVRHHVIETGAHDGRVLISKYCNAFLGALIPSERRILNLTPISLMKAVKNEQEVAGMRLAHLRDSASIIVFLAWLEHCMTTIGPSMPISEVEAADKLTAIKATQAHYVGRSFPTISASGPNAAIVHYFPVPDSPMLRNLSRAEMYLLDSGSHYLDGTTDITRSVHFGNPSEHQRDCYTRVLKGHIAVASAVFPNRTPGAQLDSLGRQFLWQVGLDYGHGTGHGIGAYLNVGEGPQSMAAKYNPDDPGLRANMFLSNEPGYYERDSFGIRLENIVRVANSSMENFLKFETVSFVPFSHKLIKIDMLSSSEIEWLNEYHAECREWVSMYLHEHGNEYGSANDVDRALEWLDNETKSLSI